jgi:hypothetical protein
MRSRSNGHPGVSASARTWTGLLHDGEARVELGARAAAEGKEKRPVTVVSTVIAIGHKRVRADSYRVSRRGMPSGNTLEWDAKTPLLERVIAGAG